MKKLEKREKNLLLVLGVILLIGAGDFILNMDSYLNFYKEPKSENASIKKTDVNNNTKKNKNKKLLASFKDWGRDPFYDPSLRVKKRVVKQKKKTISLSLKAISMAESMSVAMINSRVLAVGDQIEGYTVKKIQAKEVTLTKDGQTTTLKLQ
ncbi:MAG: hypothetical protein D8M58_03140 [Calditrichaeota bacterium]|nr:MAG: hypothetical protein DWQ03_03940 [Calditrichota bacterium]MBL1204361.1 hypothetical protein [Calditrichota bacterium]NOG44190.1 hypothetical protein [Calditrichota bacterium]